MDSIRSRCTELLKTKLARLLVICVASCVLVAVLIGAAVTKYLVVIDDEKVQTIVYTSENQPQAILAQQNIALSPYDEIDFTGFQDNKATITIHRARKVDITADGKLNSVYLPKGTVKEALERANVKLVDDDLINVSLDEPINNNMDIIINRVVYKTITSQTPIPCEIMKVPTQTLPKGKTRVLSQGANGVLETATKQTLIDGQVVEEKLISETVVKKPITTVVLLGDPNAPVSQLIPKQPVQLDGNGNPVSYKAKYTGRATAYSSLGKRTALKPGYVAMNLSRFPRGTRLYIKTPNGSFTYGYAEVKDTGHAVADGAALVDLFFGSYQESCLFGAKTVEVYVL
ncbi:G5 domain-containing protein [Paludicola sp. MB14-C6]|uniref:3D domain-containing protein n=1 Tax=Paludihabitans sp. MB14-C6 TaxID=3070656 RepID=UPI0027DD679A|nr:3D domain-containing protein [Paludicola sp. MB14-C6]WMJ23950.1 G5 domain-containing protein [Paludicola sp. MB14-C6]